MGQFWNSDQGALELAEVRRQFPSLALKLSAKHKSLALEGPIEVAPAVAYNVVLVLPERYPRDIPALFCDAKEIPPSIDRHFFTNTSCACLCVKSEYRVHWPHGSTLALFINRLVLPFLVSQWFFQVHGCWPHTGQRSHGGTGILEAYEEFAAPLGNKRIETLRSLMLCLAQKEEPKGHHLCPCGSGLNMRKCHVQVVRQLRLQVQPDRASADLMAWVKQKMSPFYAASIRLVKSVGCN